MTKISTLAKHEVVDEKYNVILFDHTNGTAETYRVKGSDGVVYFLKLFDVAKLHPTAFDASGELFEIELLRSVSHPNLVGYKDHGELMREERKFIYLVLSYFSGESIQKKVERERISTVYEAREIAKDVLEGLNYLHNLGEPVVHNGISMDSVWIDISDDERPVARIFDFSHARRTNSSGNQTYTRDGLNPHFVAPECFKNEFSQQSDLFSVGILMYRILFGMFPWQREIDNAVILHKTEEEIYLSVSQLPISIPALKDPLIGLNARFEDALQKAVMKDVDQRFATAQEFIQALEKTDKSNDDWRNVFEETLDNVTITKSGFAAIAGMEKLKNELRRDVIEALQNPEKYRKYGLSIPNGMLLWGPPGCGKTYFVQRFSEEMKRTFIQVRPSDLGSVYIHGANEKIAQLFNDARRKAPACIFFDEFEALVPSREGNLDQHHAREVNEFLAQMSSSAEHGVFVIGAANHPEKIDPAVLRAGRIDKVIYVPPPDFEARKAMFQLYLEDRPLEENIDFDQTARLTEDYVSSDIKLMIDNAARHAMYNNARISMQILENVINNSKRSVSIGELRKYEARNALGYDIPVEINLFLHLRLGRPTWPI